MGTTRTTRLTIATVGLLAWGLMLAGCTSAPDAPDAPTATGTATEVAATSSATPTDTPSTPSATPTPAPETPAAPVDELASVDQIVMGSSGFSLKAGGAEIASVPFVSRDLDGAVATLTRALGAPTPDGVAGGHCVLPQTRWSWGGALTIGTRALHTDPGSLTAELKAATLTTPDGRSVSLTGPSGVVVGTSVGPLVAATPAEQVDSSWDTFTNLVVDPLRRTDDGPDIGFYGTLVHAPAGTIDAIVAPTQLYDYC